MKIFLSHAHIDEKAALWLAGELRGGLAREGHQVDVFCTSEPEARYPSLDEIVKPGELWEPRAEQHVRELREYLKRAIADASAYALLLTRASMRMGPWIRLEIHEATAEAQRRGIPFVPCLYEVGYEGLGEIRFARAGKRWEESQVGAPSAEQLRVEEWQAARVDSPDELEQLIQSLARTFEGRAPG
jgi:hypothetical protein